MDDLVSKMLQAYWVPCENYEKAMTNVARIVLAELLHDPKPEELKCNSFDTRAAILAFVRDRRARIERPKSPEERVTVRVVTDFGTGVFLDNKQIGPYFIVDETAEIFRLGLIEKLKQESRKE